MLAHLTYHLQNPVNPADANSPAAFSKMALEAEAKAFISAWNVTLLDAEAHNKGRDLSGRQIAQLFMNLRYRFAYKGVHWENDGTLEARDNVDTIVKTLGKSPVADLE